MIKLINKEIQECYIDQTSEINNFINRINIHNTKLCRISLQNQQKMTTINNWKSKDTDILFLKIYLKEFYQNKKLRL